MKINPTENLLTQQRADEIYAAHLASGQGDWNRTGLMNLVTHDENLAVRARWSRLPGTTCWFDAFTTFMSEDKLPPFMRLRTPACKAYLEQNA